MVPDRFRSLREARGRWSPARPAGKVEVAQSQTADARSIAFVSMGSNGNVRDFARRVQNSQRRDGASLHALFGLCPSFTRNGASLVTWRITRASVRMITRFQSASRSALRSASRHMPPTQRSNRACVVQKGLCSRPATPTQGRADQALGYNTVARHPRTASDSPVARGGRGDHATVFASQVHRRRAMGKLPCFSEPLSCHGLSCRGPPRSRPVVRVSRLWCDEQKRTIHSTKDTFREVRTEDADIGLAAVTSEGAATSGTSREKSTMERVKFELMRISEVR